MINADSDLAASATPLLPTGPSNLAAFEHFANRLADYGIDYRAGVTVEDHKAPRLTAIRCGAQIWVAASSNLVLREDDG